MKKQQNLLSIFFIFTIIVLIFAIIFIKNFSIVFISLYYAVALLLSFSYVYLQKNRYNRVIYSVLLFAILSLFLTSILLLIHLHQEFSTFFTLLLVSSFFILSYLLLIFIFKFILKSAGLETNSAVSDKLTEKFIGISNETGTNFSVYLTSKTDAVTSRLDRKSNTVKIYINELFITELNESEVRAAIFHEIGHFKQKAWNIDLYIFPALIYSYFIGYSYFLLNPPGSTFTTYVSIPILLFMIVSFFILVKEFTRLTDRKEQFADHYSVEKLRDYRSIIGLLEKTQSYYESQAFLNSQLSGDSISRSFLRRISKIKEYAHEANGSKR